MNEERFHIIASILKKRLQEELSAEDTLLLDAWLTESPENREVVERLNKQDLVASDLKRIYFSGTRIREKIEIGLPEGEIITRRYRNRQIGNILKELKLTEGKCTGIFKILKEMRRNGSPVPEFRSDEYRTALTVTMPVHEVFLEEEETESGIKLTKKQQEVYDYIQQDPSIGYRELARILNTTLSTVQKHINALKSKGIMVHEGPNKGGYWKILKKLEMKFIKSDLKTP